MTDLPATAKLEGMRPSAPLRLLHPLVRRLAPAPAMTLGVRVLALDGARVFLVRHTYREGWYLPGGGVDRGESAEAAALRELAEEGGLAVDGRPELHGVFRNGRRDHVVCYVARRIVRPTEAFRPTWEIADAAFFPMDDLPQATTRATRARLTEVIERRAPTVDW